MLYPVELQARSGNADRTKEIGRGREIRTPDILLPKQARYQTALDPVRRDHTTPFGVVNRSEAHILRRRGRISSPRVPVSDTKRLECAFGFDDAPRAASEQTGALLGRHATVETT